jgi:molecular chaperone DnaJ
MASKRDYYEVLGLERGADEQEIKSAYRKAAVRYHPDRNPGDEEAEERFKEATEAYSVLSDREQRARYDRFGHQGVSGTGVGGFDPSVFSEFSDILGDFFGFADLFGGRRGAPWAGRGADLRYDLVLSFEEAAFGADTTLRIPRLETCGDCGGSGSASGEPSVCRACGGHGQVRSTQGFFTVARTCPQCGGQGRVITDPCARCGGDGRVEAERQLQVKIPAGVDTGARLRLTGEGEQGPRGGPRGDLYVVIRVEPHPEFRRDGADVFRRAQLSYVQAVLGATLEVETLHGAVPLEIPPGTPHGRQFRLAGKGVERLDQRGRGDQIVEIELEVPDPRNLTAEQVELLRRLAEAEGSSVREDRRVIDKVKDLFG